MLLALVDQSGGNVVLLGQVLDLLDCVLSSGALIHLNPTVLLLIRRLLSCF